MNALTSFFLTFLALPFLAHAAPGSCVFSFKPETLKITWTGAKFTTKTPVSGTFDKVELESTPSDTLKKLYQSASVEIDTTSVNSGNSARDMTLQKTVFAFLQVPQKIKAQVTKASATNLDMAVTLNQKTPLSLNLSHTPATQKIIATGVLNLLNHGLEKSFEAVHKSCKALHTGPDGVSKTWSDVVLSIEIDYDKKCSKGFIDSIKSWFS